MTRYARALSSHTPKDTLLTLNTCIAALLRPYNVLGLVTASSINRIPSVSLAACWYEDALLMRITQSISLSNIQTFSFYRVGPPLGGGKPASQFNLTSLFRDRRHLKEGADLGTANEFWWS